MALPNYVFWELISALFAGLGFVSDKQIPTCLHGPTAHYAN